MKPIRLAVEFTPVIPDLLRRLGLDAESDEAEDFLAMVEELQPLAHPKAYMREAVVERTDKETGEVVLGGTVFQSTVLAANLSGQERVWTYLATCGREIYDAVTAIADPFERYWGEEIMQAALTQVRAAMVHQLRTDLKESGNELGKVGTMGPGSLVAWPIDQQVPLFKLLDEGVAFCGVELTPTMLMLPNKSVSGILFKSEKGWESCILCPRETCPNRRAKYNPEFALET